MKSVLIVAHPDDEVIFFSSVLKKVDKIIVCFGPCENKLASEGRQKAQERYPLTNIEWLNLQESSVFLSGNWKNPTISDSRLRVNRNKEKYQKNFEQLCAIFKRMLGGYDVVYTHNPWGEYGHEEHVSVFEAVVLATSTSPQKIFVPSYLSDRSTKLFEKRKHLLGEEIQSEIVPKDICNNLKKLYTEVGCWSFHDDYEWPNAEIFIKIKKPSNEVIMDQNIPTSNPPTMLLTRTYNQPAIIHFVRNLLVSVLPPSLVKIIKRALQIR